MKPKKPPQPKRPTRPRGVVARFEAGESVLTLASERCDRLGHATGAWPCSRCDAAVDAAIRRELKRLRARRK